MAAGTYVGTFSPQTLAANPGYEAFPLTIDVPGVALLGATKLTLDANNRPTATEGEVATLIADASAGGGQPYVLVSTTERVVGDEVIRTRGNHVLIEGFDFRFNAGGGTAIWAHFVEDYLIRGNAVVGAGGFAIQHSFSNGRTVRNLLVGNATVGISFRGPASGKAVIRENTATRNVLGGMVLVCSAGNFPLPVLAHTPGTRVVAGPVDGTLDRTEVALVANDFSHHTETPDFSFGLRVLMFGGAEDTPRAADCKVTASHNVVTDASFGIINDGGFPYRILNGAPIEAVWSSRYRGRYRNNTVKGNTEDAFVSFTRFTSTRDCQELVADRAVSYRFLRNSDYVIRHTGEFDASCHDNRELDPSSGRSLGNTLWIGRERLLGVTCTQVTPCPAMSPSRSP